MTYNRRNADNMKLRSLCIYRYEYEVTRHTAADSFLHCIKGHRLYSKTLVLLHIFCNVGSFGVLMGLFFFACSSMNHFVTARRNRKCWRWHELNANIPLCFRYHIFFPMREKSPYVIPWIALRHLLCPYVPHSVKLPYTTSKCGGLSECLLHIPPGRVPVICLFSMKNSCDKNNLLYSLRFVKALPVLYT